MDKPVTTNPRQRADDSEETPAQRGLFTVLHEQDSHKDFRSLRSTSDDDSESKISTRHANAGGVRNDYRTPAWSLEYQKIMSKVQISPNFCRSEEPGKDSMAEPDK
jgi:hypothetical protein